ncbi:MAG: antibiotic biosynthesis monooxygenase [Desulfobacterota bacterium]|nr:antibiotic biosynthesis monooxygenase [Thermodesulfobacteriota bacterium]
MDPVVVVARMQAQPGKAPLLEQAACALVAPSVAEPGCMTYELYRCPEREGALMFFERWRSREALENHLRQPHLKAFMETASKLLEGQISVSIWEKIDGASHVPS